MDPAWVTAAVALAGITGTVLVFVGRWAFKILSRTTRFLDDYFGEAARDGMPARPGVMSRLGGLESKVSEIRAEVHPNGGNSLRDDVQRAARDVTTLRGEVGEVQSAVTDVRSRLELFEQQRSDRDGKAS
jgi:hypothetical protein